MLQILLVVLFLGLNSIEAKTALEETLSRMKNLKDFEAEAKKILLAKNKREDWEGLERGSFESETAKQNLLAFAEFRIRPHYLRDISKRNLSVTLLGNNFEFPIGLSPSAFHTTYHPDGERASSSAAAEVGALMILSSTSGITLEEVAQSSPSGIKWFQVDHPGKDLHERNVTGDLMKRAEKAGFKAIVYTCDSPALAVRDEDEGVFDEGFVSPNLRKYPGYPFFRENQITWEDFEWVKAMTSLPIVLKGILTAEDARKAVEVGAAAIVVSNHGGREMDGGPTSIEALPEIVEAVGGKIEIYLDSGIRNGKDAFKALALGAKAVFVGRAIPFGLTVGGKEGVRKVLTILKNELYSVMGHTGCNVPQDITKENVAHKLSYAMRHVKSDGSHTTAIPLVSTLLILMIHFAMK